MQTNPAQPAAVDARASAQTAPPTWLSLALTAAYATALAWWLAARPAAGWALLATHVVQTGASVAAALVVATTATQRYRSDAASAAARGTSRASDLLCVAAGLAATALGDALEAYWGPAKPWWGDVAYVGGYFLLAAGLLRLPAGGDCAPRRWQLLADSLICITSVLTLVWCFLLGPAVAHAAQATVGAIASIAYPVGWLALFISYCTVTLRGRRQGMEPGGLAVGLGLACLTGADGACSWLRLRAAYVPGGAMDALWPAGYLLIAAGVAAAARPPERAPARDSALATPQTVAELSVGVRTWLYPYGLVVIAALLLVHVVAAPVSRLVRAGVLIGTAALIGAVLVRQVLALAGNSQLTERLRLSLADLAARNAETEAYAAEILALNRELNTVKAQLEEHNRTLAGTNERLRDLATLDSLTGLLNHGAFDGRLGREVARARRTRRPLAVLLLDVDYFKRFNDTHGHLAGDAALRVVARALATTVRSDMDVVGRYGGEEFAAILPDITREEAAAVAERIRSAVAAGASVPEHVTASIGVIHCVCRDETPEELLFRADQALYAAKRAGRNQVALYVPPPAAGSG